LIHIAHASVPPHGCSLLASLAGGAIRKVKGLPLPTLRLPRPGIAIAEVEPERPMGPEDTTNLTTDRYKPFHIGLR
jgi:hypothetical protein